MPFRFNNIETELISKILRQKPVEIDNSYTWNIIDPDNLKPLILTIHNDVNIGNNQLGSMVSVQSRHGYYELHNIKHIMAFEPDEVIFLTEENNTLSCLIIGIRSTCSLYSNINKQLLSSDLSELHPANILSIMQLLITEPLIEQL